MKSFLEPLRTAWVSVVTHKLRSFLTILGVVIGIAAVIILMSVGKGVTAKYRLKPDLPGHQSYFCPTG